MIKGQVKEQGFAWNGLEAWREVHEADLLADKGRIQTESLKPFRERLKETSAEKQIKHVKSKMTRVNQAKGVKQGLRQ